MEPDGDSQRGSRVISGRPEAGRAVRRSAAVRHTVEYALLRLALVPIRLIGWRGVRRIGTFLGLIAFSVVRVRRRVTLDNLSCAFPGWSEHRRLQVARDCYRHFGVTFLELCLLPQLTRADVRRLVRLEHPEQFREAELGGKGALMATGHFGNWEFTGAAVTAWEYPLWVLARSQRNRRVDAFVTWARETVGMRVLHTNRALFGVPRALRRGEFVAVVADQDAGRGGVFVPFLGRPASTHAGVARFARHAGAPIIPCFSVRQPDGRYLLEMPGPMLVRTDLPPAAAELEALKRITAHLEDLIRRHPEQWFWMHRRWKTRPAR